MTRGGWHLRFQKRITLMKGVRLNIGKRGLGVTVGGRLARFGVTSRGQLYQSASLPGSGISMRRTVAPSSPRPAFSHGWWVGLLVLAALLAIALR